jgi:hypothetical protein
VLQQKHQNSKRLLLEPDPSSGFREFTFPDVHFKQSEANNSASFFLLHLLVELQSKKTEV